MGIVTAIALGLSAASTAAGAAGASKSAKAVKKAAATRALLAGAEADSVLENGKRQAGLIMWNSERLVGQQVASQAVSGVVIGDGSARAVVEETRNLAKMDALITMQDANFRANQIRQGADFEVMAANAQASQIYAQSRANSLSTIANMATTAANAYANSYRPTTTSGPIAATTAPTLNSPTLLNPAM